MCAASIDAVNPKSLLLLGATGNGKSALGNYLIDPSKEHIIPGKGQTFATAKSNFPETKEVQSGRVRDNNFYNITIIDTPGLNDSDEKDLAHMIDLVKNLREVKGITACAIVCSFDGKIDEPFKMTIEYYGKLLPQIFENNVFVVMTKVKHGESADADREMQGIVLEENKKNIQDKVAGFAKLRFEPKVFMIDSLPRSSDRSACAVSLRIRSDILAFVSKMNSINTSRLYIAKTPYIRQKDREMLGFLKSEQMEHEDNLIEKERKAKEVRTHRAGLISVLGDEGTDFNQCRRELDMKDTDDLIPCEEKALQIPWYYLKKGIHFEIISAHKIAYVEMQKTDHLRSTSIRATDQEVKGSIKGTFLKPMHAKLTINTHKKHLHATEIAKLREKERNLRENMEALEEEFKRCSIHGQETTYNDEIKTYQRKIEEVQSRIQACEGEYMTVDEAEQRLKEF